MKLNKNIELLTKFIKKQSGSIIINKVNDEVTQFYFDSFKFYANQNGIEIKNIEIQQSSINDDLFSIKKIMVIHTNNKKEIDSLINQNGNIIFTDYRNYKAFNKYFNSINAYEYENDIVNFLRYEFKIENNDFISECLAHPSMVFAELSKYLINKEKYLKNYKNNKENNPILLFRKKFYDEKKNGLDIKKLYKILKDEVLVKKFNFLTF